MKVIKADGLEAAYSPEKIACSLKRAGANTEMIQQVLYEIEEEIYDGIDTRTLYRIVFRKLKKLCRNTANKYHLKTAIMELGPSGFPFENFIAALLEAEGYHTMTNQMIQGNCVKHEIDVIADKDNNYFMVECKFHSNPGNICDIKIALYVHARFLDVEKAWLKTPELLKKIHKELLVTNTRLSRDAEQYGQCVGMGLLSWTFPQGNSLRDRIDKNGLYPVTCLTSLTRKEKKKLLDKNIVLCRTLHEHPSELSDIGISESKKERVLEEASMILKTAAQQIL